MDLFNKIRSRVDFNNSYTMQKALSTLNFEFSKAMRINNIIYARNILSVAKRLYDDFSTSFVEGQGKGETMSYNQKLWGNRMKYFIGYLIKALSIAK